MPNTTEKENIYVIGHKNPDTDSVCSAISYAYLKSQISSAKYLPRVAGSINNETKYVLSAAGVKCPEFLEDVRTQVCDIEIRKNKGISKDISLKRAWEIMKAENAVTLPVLCDSRLEGLITTGDIAKTYMEIYDSRILSRARTCYQNIVDTLSGEVIVGDPDRYFEEGKVLIGVANPDMMESYIDTGDLVILGNRYESQLCAIEMKASCIVVCEDAKVSLTIQRLAQDKNCMIITTPFDTYTVARLINQSMPVYFCMKTDDIITFRLTDYIDNIQGIMGANRVRYFPILDANDKYVGLISRRNVLNATPKKLILVDHNEKDQAVDGVDQADILEIIDHHRIGSIETMSPVYFRNQPLGCTATIIYQLYQENQVEIPVHIAKLLCSAIISDTLMFRSPTCTEIDKNACMHLAEIAGLSIEEHAAAMFKAGSNLSDKTEKEIFYQDFKLFNLDKYTLGIGQINVMDKDILLEIRDRITPYMKAAAEKGDYDMSFFMLTDIINSSTLLLFSGEKARKVVELAFHVTAEENDVLLPSVVSRKKQLLPALIRTINQEVL